MLFDDKTSQQKVTECDEARKQQQQAAKSGAAKGWYRTNMRPCGAGAENSFIGEDGWEA